MLKLLKAAIRDGDVIHAVIKGTAENHGGRTNSLTAPNPKSQAAVIEKAVKKAGLDFSQISYIECHGTGTELGDPVEIEGLKTVAGRLLKQDQDKPLCKLGSIKSNIGHLEMAAGVAGMIKVILQMQHKKIAKSLHCDTINPYINLKETSFGIAQEASDWEMSDKQKRIAGVSSFGFGGVNAHVILEEYVPLANEPAQQQKHQAELAISEQERLLVFSARTEEALLIYLAQYPQFIETLSSKDPEILARIAYSLQTGRAEMQERVVFVVKSIDDWNTQLQDFLESKGTKAIKNTYRGTVKSSDGSVLEIGDTEAGREYIQKLIAAREINKLAELWVKGSKIDWGSLY